jgi:hypothetical protein
MAQECPMVFPDNLRSISFQEPNESAKPPLRNAGISDGRPTLVIRNPAFVIAAHCGQIVGRIPFRRERHDGARLNELHGSPNYFGELGKYRSGRAEQLEGSS